MLILWLTQIGQTQLDYVAKPTLKPSWENEEYTLNGEGIYLLAKSTDDITFGNNKFRVDSIRFVNSVGVPHIRTITYFLYRHHTI